MEAEMGATQQSEIPRSTVYSGMQYSFDATTQRIAIAFQSGTLFYRVHFGVNGFNDLPNFVGVDKSSDAHDWVKINSASTDWLPPLRVAAAANGDGSDKYATGGNHGNVDKAARGDQTARNVIFQIRADGRTIADSIDGHAESIDMLVVNEVMGWNTTPTVNSPRYIMRQSFNITFKAGSCEVQAHLEALEDVLLARDSALQCVASGSLEQVCFYGGSSKQPYVNGTSSGAKADAPDVMGVGLFSESNGQMTMWLDRSWEAGRGMMLLEDHPLVRLSGNKAYLAVALDVDANQTNIHTTVPLSAGQSYRYRGGYAWQAPTDIPGIESSFYHHIDGKAHYTYVTSDGRLVTV